MGLTPAVLTTEQTRGDTGHSLQGAQPQSELQPPTPFRETHQTTRAVTCSTALGAAESVAAWQGDLEMLAGAPLPGGETLIPISLLPLCTWHKGLGFGGTEGPHGGVWEW